jgi:glycosyltransferase involved in cell wall biosynthesis
LRPVIFDATHLVVRQGRRTPTGIDRVDQMYGAHFARSDAFVAAVQVLNPFARTLRRATLEHYSDSLAELWRGEQDPEADPAFRAWRGFITSNGQLAGTQIEFPVAINSLPSLVSGAAARLFKHDRGVALPMNALLLSVSQNPFLVRCLSRFLTKRPDLKPIFLLHDLIPIDHPEFFPPGRAQQFSDMLEIMFNHAAAFIATSEYVAGRLRDEMVRRNRSSVPICVAPLPPPPEFLRGGPFQQRYADSRYVVMLGTFEPRKNHWLMLNIWHRMIENGDHPPKLVIVGARGWEAEVSEDLLRRTPELRGHVLHVSGMSDAALRVVISHARALVMPSFEEGFGMPVVEAASVGTPVIASSHPVFAEVSQGRARQVDALDGPGWRNAVLDVAGPASSVTKDACMPLAGFKPSTPAQYFASVTDFMEGI